MPDCIIVHYGEIALKGQNRRYFEKKLARNLRDALPAGADVSRVHSRILISLEDYNKEDVISALAKTAGVSNFCFATECGSDFASLKSKTIELLDGKVEGKTFKVAAAGDGFPLSSSEIEKELGAAVVERYKIRASMKTPDVTVHVETFDSAAYMYTEKFAGLGGLPVGSSGRVISLLSGGIDSPVSSWLVMKRGCRPLFAHFHALRNNEEAENSKIADLVKAVLPYCLRTRVYYIPYSIFQIAASGIPPEYEVIVFRRFMNRVAGEIAKRERAKGIVTGESIAQVASQTLDNMIASEDAAELPVIWPLAAMDKEEIISLAKKLGTYDISIRDYKDCCSIISRHPKTRPKLEKIKELESAIDMTKLVHDTLDAAKVVAYKYGKGKIEAKEVPIPGDSNIFRTLMLC